MAITTERDHVTRTLLVDDHALYRIGLRILLERYRDLEVVAEVDGSDAAMTVVSSIAIDLALVDLHMPRVGGLALTRRLLAACPACKVIVLSAVEEPLQIAQAIAAGANGYVFKTQAADELVDAIRNVEAGLCYLPPTVSRDDIARLGETDPLALLSAREREVLELLVLGRSNDDIASRLFVSRRTVETHRQRIMKKLGTHTIAELIHFASRYGLVS